MVIAADLGTSYSSEIAFLLYILGRSGMVEIFKAQLMVSEVLVPRDNDIAFKSNTTLIRGTLQVQNVIIMHLKTYPHI